MTPCVWRILCLRNSSSVPYFRQPPNLPTAARRNRKCTECGTPSFGRNRMSAESARLSTFYATTSCEPVDNRTTLVSAGCAQRPALLQGAADKPFAASVDELLQLRPTTTRLTTAVTSDEQSTKNSSTKLNFNSKFLDPKTGPLWPRTLF